MRIIKFLVIATFLWLEVVTGGFGQTENEVNNKSALMYPPIAAELNKYKEKSKMVTDGNYHFHATQQLFYFGGFPPNSLPTFPKIESAKKQLPPGYIMTNGIGAHKLHLTNATWNDARISCINESGHLAVIRSDTEEKIVSEMMAEQKLRDAWVGYHNGFDDGQWFTVFDEPLREIQSERLSQKVYPHRGINPGKMYRCGRLLPNGDLTDYHCSQRLAFVCKISMKE